MRILKTYKLGFDAWALALFLVIMIPTFIWLAVPAPHDVLRGESATALLDTVASISQVLMVISLCILINREQEKLRITPLIVATLLSCLLYFICWLFYYLGATNALVLLGLTIPPCLAFLFYSIDRKNMIAVALASVFTVCHVIHAAVNYIVF